MTHIYAFVRSGYPAKTDSRASPLQLQAQPPEGPLVHGRGRAGHEVEGFLPAGNMIGRALIPGPDLVYSGSADGNARSEGTR